MSVITIKKKRAFLIAYDDILVDSSMSERTRLVLTWMVGRPDGWELRVGHIRATFKISECQWRVARKEMEAAGYFRQIRDRGENGKIVWSHIVTDERHVPPSPPKPSDGEPSDDAPSNDKLPDKTTGSKADNKTNTKTTTSGGGIELFFGEAGKPPALESMLAALSKHMKKATEEQVRWAAVAWREGVAKGDVNSPEGYAVQLCKQAALGQVMRPSSFGKREQKEAAAKGKDEWVRLAALAGKQFRTPKGKIASINPGGVISFSDGSVSGADALKLLGLIESGKWSELP